MSEVAKTLQAVENATSEFLSLGIDDGALKKTSKLLLDIDRGGLTTEVARGRGHWHIIGNIYYSHIDKWFERVFKPSEYALVKEVFSSLSNADSDLFANLTDVALVVEKEAAEVLQLVVKGAETDARARVLSALPVLRPLRQTMSRTMQTLYSLQGEFADIAARA